MKKAYHLVTVVSIFMACATGTSFAQTAWNRIQVGEEKIYIPKAEGVFENYTDPTLMLGYEITEIYRLKAVFNLLPPDIVSLLTAGGYTEAEKEYHDLFPLSDRSASLNTWPHGEVRLVSMFENVEVSWSGFFEYMRNLVVDEEKKTIEKNIEKRIEQQNMDKKQYFDCVNLENNADFNYKNFGRMTKCKKPKLIIAHGNRPQHAVINGNNIKLGVFVEREDILGMTSIINKVDEKSSKRTWLAGGGEWFGEFGLEIYEYVTSDPSIKIYSEVWVLVKNKILIIQALRAGVTKQQEIDLFETKLETWAKKIIEYNESKVAEKFDPEPNALARFFYRKIWPYLASILASPTYFHLLGIVLIFLGVKSVCSRLYAYMKKHSEK